MNRDLITVLGGIVAFAASSATYLVATWLEVEAGELMMVATFVVIWVVAIIWGRRFPH